MLRTLRAKLCKLSRCAKGHTAKVQFRVIPLGKTSPWFPEYADFILSVQCKFNVNRRVASDFLCPCKMRERKLSYPLGHGIQLQTCFFILLRKGKIDMIHKNPLLILKSIKWYSEYWKLLVPFYLSGTWTPYLCIPIIVLNDHNCFQLLDVWNLEQLWGKQF